MSCKEFYLDEIATFKYGKMPKKDQISDIGYPIFTGYKFVGFYPEYNIEDESIIVVARGVGGTGDVKICPKKTYLTNLSIAVSFDPSIINYKYFYYMFKLSNLRYLDTGSAQSQITINDLKRLQISLPSLETQNNVIDILSSLDDKIELNNKINKNLEEMAQALYKQWFVDFEFLNEDGEPYKSSSGEMVESELGLIPKGWEVKDLKDICKNDVAICGKTPSTKNKDYYGADIPFIKIPDMHNVIYVVDSNTKLSKEGQESQSNKTLPKGSICISCIGSPGLAVITIEDSQTNQQINSVIPKTEELLYYTYLNLESRAEEIKALGSAGTTLYNLNKTSFEKIKIIVPHKNVLSHFHKIIEPNFQTILNGYLQNMELSKTRDLLLPKLMSGEIEVPIEG